MKLRANELCPIHGSLYRCGRTFSPNQSCFDEGEGQRIEDPHQSRAYSGLRSAAEMGRLPNRRIVEQDRICTVGRITTILCLMPMSARMPTFRICRLDWLLIK
jgi:hypothetical protein